MGVGTPLDPNFENPSQGGTAYKIALDNAIKVGKRFATAFACYENTPPNNSVLVYAGYLYDGIIVTDIAAQVLGSIPAPVVQPRIDRIVVDRLTAVASRIQGVENASPVAPAIPATALPNARIALAVGQTVIANTNITDERVAATGSSPAQSTFSVGPLGGGNVSNRLAGIFSVSNTIDAFTIRIIVRSRNEAGGKSGALTVGWDSADFTVTHNRHRIQSPIPTVVVTSEGPSPTGFTGTLQVNYQ